MVVVNVTRQSGKQARRQGRGGPGVVWCKRGGVGFLAQDEVEDKAGIYFLCYLDWKVETTRVSAARDSFYFRLSWITA